MGACENLFPELWVRDKFFQRFGAFGGVALHAGKREIGNPVGASGRFWNDVFDVQNLVGFPTVNTGASVFFEEILLQFVTE